MTDADRVMYWHLHPLFVGASDREVARAARVRPEYAREQRHQVDHERGMAALLERADALRVLDGFEGDAVAYLESLLGRALVAHSRSLRKRLERQTARSASPNPLRGGARPPEQSRGASPTRNGDDGRGRGSKVTGLGADR
jgi:hypothetical protein